MKGLLTKEQKLAYEVRQEDKHLRGPPTDLRMFTLSPNSRDCSIPEGRLPERADSLVLDNGCKVSKPIGKPKEITILPHSLKIWASSTESTMSCEIKANGSFPCS